MLARIIFVLAYLGAFVGMFFYFGLFFLNVPILLTFNYYLEYEKEKKLRLDNQGGVEADRGA